MVSHAPTPFTPGGADVAAFEDAQRARLNIAAPALLAFAKAALPVLEDELELRTCSLEESYIAPVSALVAQAQRAIALAEGKTK